MDSYQFIFDKLGQTDQDHVVEYFDMLFKRCCAQNPSGNIQCGTAVSFFKLSGLTKVRHLISHKTR